MRTMPLQLLTSGTVTTAVGSAVWLSNTDQAAVFCSAGYRATSGALDFDLLLPAEPTRAGPPDRAPRPSATRQAPAVAS